MHSRQKTGSDRICGPDRAVLRRGSGIILSASVVWLAVFGTGSASACKLTDPTCVVDKVEETAHDTVGDVQEQADETVEEVNGTVDDVKNTASGTVDKVKETVNETVNPGGSNPTTPNPPTGPVVPPGKEKPKEDERPHVKGSNGERKNGPERTNTGGSPRRAASLLPPIAPTIDLTAPGLTKVNFRPPAEPGLAESAIEAAKDFVFPLLLAFIVGAFLVIQHRVDREEPKLIFAPIDHDLLSFE